MSLLVAEVVTWATHETALKSYLDVSGSDEDVRLESLLLLATIAADEYFDGDLDELDDVPQLVIDGCYEFVRLARDEDLVLARAHGVTSAKTRDLQQAFDSRAEATPLLESILTEVGSYWWPYKIEILP